MKLMACYMGLLYVLTRTVPGYRFKGPPLRDGRQITFYINALPILVITVILFCCAASMGIIAWTVCYDHFWGLLGVCQSISVVTSTYLLLRGRMKKLGTLSMVNDFIMGQELVIAHFS